MSSPSHPYVVVYTECIHDALVFRGEDISRFLPHPEVILMADVVYYEEVQSIMIALIVSTHPINPMSYIATHTVT